MKRPAYKAIRRQPKRIYTHSTRNPKKRKRLFLFLLVLGILLLIFIPGHNGLIQLAAKKLKIQKLHNDIENLKMKIELVRAKVDRTKDPKYIKRYAQDRFGMTTPKPDTTAKKPLKGN